MAKSNRGGVDIDAVELKNDSICEIDIVLFRKGGKAWPHRGTIYFSTIIELHQWQYCKATPNQKRIIATSILDHVRKSNCRFLQQKGKDRWQEISDNKFALQKIQEKLHGGHAERDKLLRNQLVEAIASKTTATACIEVPLLVVTEVIASTLASGLNDNETQSNSGNEGTVYFYAIIELPCKHTTKATLVALTDISSSDISYNNMQLTTKSKPSVFYYEEMIGAPIPTVLECSTTIPDDNEE
jgi:hypothetical protein